MEAKDPIPDADVEMPDAEQKEEVQPTEPNPVPGEKPGMAIGGLVNQKFVSDLMEMGYTREVAEKSLLNTGNSGAGPATDWIQEHQDDPDFLEEMRVGEVTTEDPNKPKLSKEEKERILNERIEAVRKQKAEEEKRQAEEREVNRIKATKDLQVAKRKMEETQAKLAIQEQMREKAADAAAKKEMLAKLRADKRERGIEVDSDEEEGPKKAKVKIGMDTVKEGIKIVETLYTEKRKPGVAKTCFKTFNTFLKNVLKDPSNEKFRQLNLMNEKIQERIAKINGGLMMLKGVGFKVTPDGEKMILDEGDIDLDLIKSAQERMLAKI